MLEFLIALIIVVIFYSLIFKNKKQKPNSFDEYLIQLHKQRTEMAKHMYSTSDNTVLSDKPDLNKNITNSDDDYEFIKYTYLFMLKNSNKLKYPVDEIKKEAMQQLKCNEYELMQMLKDFK